jgi:hypothetical protein
MEENGSSCSRILCKEWCLIELYGVRVASLRCSQRKLSKASCN